MDKIELSILSVLDKLQTYCNGRFSHKEGQILDVSTIDYKMLFRLDDAGVFASTITVSWP